MRTRTLKTSALWLAALAMPATAVMRKVEEASSISDNGRVKLGFRRPTWRTTINSHKGFTHDSIDSLGYDWERIANPSIKPRFPLKVYLPQTTDDIVKIVKEVKALGEHLAIRSAGHSSNNLVLNPGGSVLLTRELNQVVEIDEVNMTATVQAGMISAQLDDRLSTRGLGLPIIGDHNHITVGGFASVGGISPASHRFGLFVDTIERIEYVNWDGEVVTASRTENPDQFYAVLTGRGQHGVIATITVKIIKIAKYDTVLKNHEKHYFDVPSFIKGAGATIRNPGDAQYERGVWLNYPFPGGRSVGVGQFSAYHNTGQTWWAKARDYAAYTYLDGLGWGADHVPTNVGAGLKLAGMLGVIMSPQYATIKNVEFFTDKVLDSMVGDPTRMFIILAPLDRFDTLFQSAYDLMVEFRTRYQCFTFLSVYVKSIHSPYLAQGGSNDRFCELMFYNGIDNAGMTPAVTEELVNRFDDIVIANQGFRYMHSLTSSDPERRRLVDPNVYYSSRFHGPQSNGASPTTPAH
ncbi:MAG: FAD-binding oxidoreductase [Actinomycetota bacterium]|nr:FAD-binding oxidoreductase [Actinomycetota bacterium]MDQ6945311.1 FAD-binding oxidoreductase [Actinomycetota bacterium]